jgi:hypothetical protein
VWENKNVKTPSKKNWKVDAEKILETLAWDIGYQQKAILARYPGGLLWV